MGCIMEGHYLRKGKTEFTCITTEMIDGMHEVLCLNMIEVCIDDNYVHSV